MKIDYKYLCIVGDIHGEFPELIWTVTQKGLKDTAFIVAGDFGLGFCKPGYYERVYTRIKRRLENNHNILLGLRGNHDNPEYYRPESKLFLNFPLFKALPDYTRLEWGEREILVIGGATSKDKSWRLENLKKRPWWKDERPIQDFSKINPKEDIIISHEAPISIGPIVSRSEDMSLETYQEILNDRGYLSKVLVESRPDRWIYGHYHKSMTGTWGETLWTGLGINEIYEIH